MVLALCLKASVVAVFLYWLWRRKLAITHIEHDSFVAQKGAMFRILYTLYARTPLGSWYTSKDIAKAKLKFPNGHSQKKTFTYGSIEIRPIPIGFDNWTYLIVDRETNDCVLVDVSDVETVLEVLKADASIKPIAVLTTHKHWDHCRGNLEMKSLFPSIEIYGSKTDCPPGLTQFVNDNQELQIGSLTFTALLTPGHTSGHVVYNLHHGRKAASISSGEQSLFTGDLLFLCGLGKMFEGSPKTTISSLETIGAFSDETLIWPGHEYAVDNMKFAATVDPDNMILKEKRVWIHVQREDALPTCPSTLGEERQYNPFLRTSDRKLLRLLDINTDAGDTSVVVPPSVRIDALKQLRKRKDEFTDRIVYSSSECAKL